MLQIVPDGCIDIVWTGQRLQVAGPDTKPVLERFPAASVIVGVRFLPGAAPSWLGVPASEIVNSRVPLEEFWSADGRRLAAQLHAARDARAAAAELQSVLVARLPGTPSFDAAARAAFHMIARDDDGPRSVSKLAARLGLGERTLRRRCESAFGYGPKTLDRILRFQRFLGLLRRSAGARIAELAAASGFADQAHLTRDVRRLGGLTPAEFAKTLRAQGWRSPVGDSGPGSPGTPKGGATAGSRARVT
jgi:AraC-like DNA-binding protein